MNTLLKLKILRGNFYEQKIARQNLKDTLNCLNLPNIYLMKKCGVNRLVFHQILRLLEPVIPKTQRSNGIPFPLKILVTLSFLSTGGHQKSIGNDFNINISQKSVSRVINLVIEGLNKVLDKCIIFPSTKFQRKQIKDGFSKKYHFPDTIGYINGTHVEIVCPRDDEEAFYNEKGQYSIHAQIICDADEKVVAICCRYGGAASSAYIWNKMLVRSFIEEMNKQGETGWLLGDNRYPQRPWLMTPILHATQGTPESQYNNFHNHTKTSIDKCINKLKSRWLCLSKKPLHYSPERAAKIINACAVLHNLCTSAGIPDPNNILLLELGESISGMDIQDGNLNDLYEGLEVRRQLVERIYYNV